MCFVVNDLSQLMIFHDITNFIPPLPEILVLFGAPYSKTQIFLVKFCLYLFYSMHVDKSL